MANNAKLSFKEFINQYFSDPKININKFYEELLSFFQNQKTHI